MKKIIFYILFIILGFTPFTKVNAQLFQWAKMMGIDTVIPNVTNNKTEATKVHIGKDGNIYTIGRIYGSLGGIVLI